MRNVVIFEKKNTPRNFKALKNTKKYLDTPAKKKNKFQFTIYQKIRKKKFRKKKLQKKYCKNFSPILVFEKEKKLKLISLFLLFKMLSIIIIIILLPNLKFI